MKRTSLVWTASALIASLAVSACGREEAFRAAYQTAAAPKADTSLVTVLLRLDQTYPDRLELKVDLGALYLAAGDPRTARVYLEQGARLERRSRDRRLRANLHADLAQLELITQDYNRAVDHATTALALDPTDRLGVVFTRAKANRALGREADALSDCERGWKDSQATMGRDDYLACADLFYRAERWVDTLGVLREHQRRLPYESGMGLRESLLYEKLGRIEESVLAAFKELEYLRFAGRSTDGDLGARLEALAVRLGDGQGRDLVKALLRYVSEDYASAAAALGVLLAETSDPFGRYLALASAMETGGPDPASLLEYQGIEPSLRGLAGYYYHLWRVLRRGGSDYSPQTALPILARSVLLGPSSRFAAEGRQEMGRLAGMRPEDARWLLLDEEIREIAAQAAAGADPNVLNPLYRLLDTPDNRYQLSASLATRELAKIPAVREVVARRRDTATGRLRERLDYVLSE